MSSIISKSSKKFAVLVGINYFNTSNELSGCINDATHLKEFLIERCGYVPENIITLTDNNQDALPTKQNIMNSFAILVEKANEGFNELWFSYSGHGYHESDKSGDEDDGYDEVLCPVDCSKNGMIVDDDIYSHLISKLPKGVTLFSLMDCCHSGTILDLPYIYRDSLKTNNAKSHDATVISISGCRDDQTSADAYIGTDYEGAMTWSFLNALSQTSYNIGLVDLIERMRHLLAKEYTQIPMLSLSSAEDIKKSFISVVTDAPKNKKSVKFSVSTDYWYRESSWNVLSVDTNKFIFQTDNYFTGKYEKVDTVIDLYPGKYKLVIKDSYGDGGAIAKVTCGLVTLVSAYMTSGTLAEYTFII